MEDDRSYRFERVVFGLSIAFVAVPFLGPLIVGLLPGQVGEGDLGASMLNALDVVVSFLFAGLLSIAHGVNIAVFTHRRKPFWHKPLSRSVAVMQVVLFSLVLLWLITQLLNVTVFGRNEVAYYVIWAEGGAIALLTFATFVRACAVGPWEVPEGAPEWQGVRD